MRVLQLNSFDVRGGAARAAYRIHTALRKAGVSSEMMVSIREGQDESIKSFPVSFQSRKMKFVRKLQSFQVTSNPTLHSCNLFPSWVYKKINQSDVDIVHLHWIAGELISIAEIKKINKPLVWTLHDMWAFSGAEHYDDINTPGRYRKQYNQRNRPAAHRGILDVDAWTWRRKKTHWRNVDFNFVTPSKWLAGCLSQSALFPGQIATVIPNCLDTNIFQPTNKKQARDLFNLPQDKQLILCSADGVERNPLKGYSLLQEALKHLSLQNSANKMECVFFGRNGKRPKQMNGIPVTEVGRINDDNTLGMLYSAADVFVTPSMMDNLPNTIMEAMSCGTPCVAFNVGGIPDMIESEENGFLAQPFDSRELAEGLIWTLADSERHYALCQSAREKVVGCFTPEIVAAKYRLLYDHIISSSSSTVNMR